jgi:hypothetical protein
VQRHFECRDDAKVSASSTNSPVKVRILVRTGLDLASVGKNQLGGEDVVAAEAVFAHERTDASAKKETADAHGRTLTEHSRKSRFGGLDLDSAAQHSAANACVAFVGCDGHVAEAGHIENDACVAGGVCGVAVAAAADGEREMIVADEVQGGLDVLKVERMHDDQRVGVVLG